MTSIAVGRLHVEVVDDTQGFLRLEDEWHELYARSQHATPFQSWGWLYSWWETYGAGRNLCLLTVRQRERLVGVLPLMREGRSAGRLRFVGTGLSDHLDGLAERGAEDEVVAAWASGLRALGRWGVADLEEVPPGAVVRRLCDRWSPAVAIPQTVCLQCQATDWDGLLAPLSRNSRSRFRRAVRAADAAGVRAEDVHDDDLAGAVAALVSGHRSQWRERGITPEHLSLRFASFLTSAVVRMAAHGHAELVEFRDDHEVHARVLLLIGGDYVGEYMYSATQEALDRWHVTALWMRRAVATACRRGLHAVNFLRGTEDFKHRWAPEERVSHRILLGRRGLPWAAAVARLRLRARAVEVIRGESTPDWVETAARRVRAGRRS